MTTDEARTFAMADLAENYRIGLAELEKLRDALAPAFALGLQQAFQNPARWPDLSRLFSGGGWPTREATVGEGLLGLFFTPPGLREAVSRQASAMTGIAPAMVAELMPRLAALGTEAMMRATMANLLPRPSADLPADEFGRITAEMMRRGANAMEAFSTPAGTPPRATAAPMSPFFMFDAFGEAMRAATGGPVGQVRQPTAVSDPQAPFAPLFEAFAKGMRSAAAATPAAGGTFPAGSPATGGEAAAPRPDPDLMDAFVQSGRRLQESYVREMTALFARFPAGETRS